MIKLALAGIIVLILIIAFLLIIRNKPDFWFWIFLNLYFDPGGYVTYYLDGKLVGPLNVTDVLIVGMIFCLVFAKIKLGIIYQDQFLTKFLLYLFIFTLYYFIVYGGIVPYFHNDFDYVNFLLKNRMYFYGIIILISVYIFSLGGLKYFYTSTIFIAVICLSLYFITLVTGLDLIPVWKFQREGTAMTRISMLSYGLFDSIFPLALIAYLLSRKINLNLKNKFWLFLGGVIMVITLLITLTRRTQIDIIATVLIITLIISYLFRSGKIVEMFKIIIPAVLVIITLYFTFPKYVDFITETGENTLLLLTGGKDSEGQSEDRVSGTGDLEITKEYINNNLLFGTGYSYLYWGPGYAYSRRGATYSRAADAAGEVPIYYLLFGYGIAGAILMIPLYFMMGKLFFNLIRLLKLTLKNYLYDPITLIFSVYVLLTIASKFTIQLAGLGYDFGSRGLNYTGILMGIGFALYRKMCIDIYKE